MRQLLQYRRVKEAAATLERYAEQQSLRLPRLAVADPDRSRLTDFATPAEGAGIQPALTPRNLRPKPSLSTVFHTAAAPVAGRRWPAGVESWR